MVIPLLFFYCLLHISMTHAEAPLLSSKAVRISMKAKEAIDGHVEGAILTAVKDLQSILRDSSFRRLEPQAQVHILFLLSKGLERLEKYSEQERLLLSYAKKEELYRFRVPLKTALARSFIHQHRLQEAESILSKIVKSSCAHLPLEEKGEIAKVLVFKDEYLGYLLRQADKLTELGRWEEALNLYYPVLEALQRQQFPYQSSPVDRQRLTYKVLLRIAEALFCQGNFSDAISTLTSWDEALLLDPNDQPLLTRRIFLIASAYQRIGEVEKASEGFQQYFSSPYLKRPFLDKYVRSSPLHIDDMLKEDPAAHPTLLSWKAQEALQGTSPKVVVHSTAFLQDKVKSGDSITHLLKGFSATLEHDIPTAVDELMLGLSKPVSYLDVPWRTASLHLLAECGFERMMLLVCSHQLEESIKLAHQLLPFFSRATHPETLLKACAIHFFVYKATEDTAHLSAFDTILDKISKSQQPYNASSFSFLRSLQDGSPNVLADDLSISDRYFAAWVGKGNMPQLRTENTPDGEVDATATPFSKYLSALFAYQQALAHEESLSQATSILRDCLITSGLHDVRPHLLHCLLDLSLRSDQLTEAKALINDMVRDYPEYPCLPQAILSSIFGFEHVPDFSEEKTTLCDLILKRNTADIHALILANYLFEIRQQPLELTSSVQTQNTEGVSSLQPIATKVGDLPHDPLSTCPGSEVLSEAPVSTPSPVPRAEDLWQREFNLALASRATARSLAAESVKSKEPSVIKERVQSASKAFDLCRSHALACTPSFHDSQSLCAIWGLLFGMESEQIEMLVQYIGTDSAFNELPYLLETAGSTLREDLATFEMSVPPYNRHIRKNFLDSCSSLPQTAELCSLIFRRDLEGAIVKAKEVPEAWRTSRQATQALLFLAKTLREAKRPREALDLLSPLHEAEITDSYELALEIAMEKSLCLRELHQPDKAKALLAWVINGPYASSLRVKAMLLRADLYLTLHRTDLAIRQLESVAAKGGEWGAAADRKLKELYGIDE